MLSVLPVVLLGELVSALRNSPGWKAPGSSCVRPPIAARRPWHWSIGCRWSSRH